MSAETTHSTGGADRVLYVLAALAQHGKPINVRDLGSQTKLAKSTLYRQLALLKRWGFVLEADGEYAPGPISLQLAVGFDLASHLVREAHADMQSLVEQSRESVGLIVAVKDQAICLDMIESSQSLRCSFEKGRGVALRAGASAKSLLAFMPEQQRIDIVTTQSELGRTQAQELLAELAQIRARGYATSLGEVDEGVWGVSAPLFRHRDKAIGSITLMAPGSRTLGREESLTRMTLDAARRISARLQNF